MSDKKDAWDKFDIIFKSIVLGLIPIVIKFGADNIAQSLKRGEIIGSLATQLSDPDVHIRRDIALIALDTAIPPPSRKCDNIKKSNIKKDKEICPDVEIEKDPVVKIAMLVLDETLDKAELEPQRDSVSRDISSEINTPASIIRGPRGGEDFYARKYKTRLYSYANRFTKESRRTNSDLTLTRDSKQVVNKDAIDQTLAALPNPQLNASNSELAGIRIVYIQHQKDQAMAKTMAQNIQTDLKSAGIFAPGIEAVPKIKENSIRYANASDRQKAENLQAYLQKTQGIQSLQLIDLSEAGYRVPSGQFEIWLE